MISEKELQELIADLESDRVERTESVNDTDKFSRAICAFANDMPNHRKPGYLLVGVKDNGTLSGLTVTDELLKNLGAIRANGQVLPQPAMTVAKFSLSGGDVAVVEVQPADMPPVRYKGIVRIRVGPRRAEANEQEEKMLTEKRISNAKTYDGWPCKGRTLGDLALGQFDAYRRIAIDAEVVAANHRTIEDQLASLRFWDTGNGCPTNAGILTFGKNPQFDFDGAYVQYLRFPGATMTDKPIDDEAVAGDIPSMVATVDRIIKVNSTKQPVTRAGSVVFEDNVYNIHPDAVREVMMNAIMHRDYQSTAPIRFYWFSDRVEIQSPGGLYGEVTPANFGRMNSYRNPVIAEVMKVIGAVNRYGFGIGRVRKLMDDNGNPEPEFILDQPYFATILRFRP